MEKKKKSNKKECKKQGRLSGASLKPGDGDDKIKNKVGIIKLNRKAFGEAIKSKWMLAVCASMYSQPPRMRAVI